MAWKCLREGWGVNGVETLEREILGWGNNHCRRALCVCVWKGGVIWQWIGGVGEGLGKHC